MPKKDPLCDVANLHPPMHRPNLRSNIQARQRRLAGKPGQGERMPCCLSREEGAGIASLPTLSTDGLCLQMQRMPTISHCRWLTFGSAGTPTHMTRPKHPTQSWGQDIWSLWVAGAAGRRLWSLAPLVALLVPGQRWACRRSGKRSQWGEVKEKKCKETHPGKTLDPSTKTNSYCFIKHWCCWKIMLVYKPMPSYLS